MFNRNCGKCGGSGNIKAYQMIAGGVCFSCGGTGIIATKTDPVKLEEKKAKKKELKVAEMSEKLKAFNSKVNQFSDDNKNNQDFISRMQGRNPKEEGFQLAQDIMRLYESKGMWKLVI